ncbi:MAG: mechanosensitive ion channel family protein [Acidobacteriota bacterium]
MFDQILTKTYYNNTITDWGTALLIVVAALVAGKILYWVSKNLVSKLTAKTKTRIDDLILDLIEEPIVFGFTAAGIWYGLQTLTLSEKAEQWIGNGLQFVIVLAITWLVARLLNSIFTFYLAPLAEASENDLDDQVLPIIRKGTTITVWSIGIIVALNNAGYEVGAVLAGLGIGGLALAMAAKDTVSNIFGGVMIFVDQPFKLNDRVRVSGFDGTIAEIGIRSTRMRTLAGTLVTIPNSVFSDSSVENVSEEPSRKVSLNLGLTYDTTPESMEQAMTTLREIAAANDHLEEKIVVSFNAFGDFAMNVLFIYYIKKDADIMETQTEVNMEVLRRFNVAGLEFAFPTQTLYTINQESS